MKIVDQDNIPYTFRTKDEKSSVKRFLKFMEIIGENICMLLVVQLRKILFSKEFNIFPKIE